MNNSLLKRDERGLFVRAVKASLPVLSGYITIGMAFGLLTVDLGFVFWFAPLTGVIMYTGAGQFMAAGMLARGTGLFELLAVEFLLAIRHAAYGFSLNTRFRGTKRLKPYLIYALSDETFALLTAPYIGGLEDEARARYMFYISALDQIYWVAGSLLGVLLGSALPFSFEGASFSLTALFIVLAIEQVRYLFDNK